MAKNKKLSDFEHQIRECVKCGVCQAHCPIYRTRRKEGNVARGKIALAAALLDNEIALEERLEQDINMCLMCGSCVYKCPNNVPTNEIVGAVRREIVEKKGLSKTGRGMMSVIHSDLLLKTLTKSGAVFSSLVLKKVPDSSGLRLRFPITAMKERTLPKIPFRNIFDHLPTFVEGDPDKPVVGFFAGCSISYLYPEIGVAMIEMLQKIGCSIHIPRSQKCCGIPALSAGAGNVVEDLAENNVTAFGQYNEEYIITACASCLGGIGEYYRSMKADLAGFTEKVIEFSSFLEKMGAVEHFAAMKRWEKRVRVTYHDPCHMKSQGLIKEPRALLKALPNVDFIEMDDASLCCGLGGTFSVYQYECSKAIGTKKMPGLKNSKADFIATSCPGCIIQLQDSINHAGLPVRAVHILDLIHMALVEK